MLPHFPGQGVAFHSPEKTTRRASGDSGSPRSTKKNQGPRQWSPGCPGKMPSLPLQMRCPHSCRLHVCSEGHLNGAAVGAKKWHGKLQIVWESYTDLQDPARYGSFSNIPNLIGESFQTCQVKLLCHPAHHPAKEPSPQSHIQPAATEVCPLGGASVLGFNSTCEASSGKLLPSLSVVTGAWSL